MPAAEASARRPTTTTASSSGSSCSMSRLPEVLTALVLALLGLTPALPAKSRNDDFSLWIDEKQVREFSGFPMEIFAILDGVVLPYILDPNFEKYLPVIPSEVNSVNFTWKAGENKNYYYDFDVLESFDSSVLANPLLSVASKGKVPRKPKGGIGPAWWTTSGLRGPLSSLRKRVCGAAVASRVAETCFRCSCHAWAT